MRLGRNLGIVLALVVAGALALAPAGQAAKSRSFAISYRADFGADTKTLLDRGGYRVTGECSSTFDGPLIQVYNGTQPGGLLYKGWTGQPPEEEGGASFDLGQPVSASFNSSSGLWEMVGYQSNGDVMVLNALTESAGDRDCTAAGVFTIVGDAEAFTQVVPDGTSSRFLGRPELTLRNNCASNGGISLTASATAPANAFAGTDLRTGHETALFPLKSSTQFADSDTDLSEVNASTPSGRVTALDLASATFPDCTVAGRVQTAKRGGSRAFFAKRAAAKPKRVEFFHQGGLHLSASCVAGQMKVFAATDSKHAMLRTTVFGDGSPVLLKRNDFSSKPAKPFYLLNFQSLHRSGQLLYARRDGHATTINWSGANVGSAYRPCLFSGIASSG